MNQMLGRIATPIERLVKVPNLASFTDLTTTLTADAVDYSSRMTEPWGMLGNDQYGCCVFAARAHHAQCASVNSTGAVRQFSTAQVLAWYTGNTGFNPSDPSTDNGAVPLDAMKYLIEIGELEAFAQVDPKNDAHVAAAIEMFGGLYSGWDLPLAWRGCKEWDVGPNTNDDWTPGSWGGHMVNQVGYDVQCSTPTVTWGKRINVSAAARHVYCSEAYVLITREWLDVYGLTPQRFDLAGLKARIREVR